jgi:putative spermidine/putrescine transport system ATP-binding protein
MAALRLEGVTKNFGGSTAVRSVSLDIASGEFFALLGPSGCGKTTLLRIIAGFESPESGAVRLDGSAITHTLPGDRAIGMVFQNYALFPHLSAFDNVAFGLRARHVPEGEVRLRVAEALRSVALGEKGGRPVPALSGGEQQRIAVARALVLRPKVLLFDEPLSNLDAALRVATREEIRTLQRTTGITTVYVTHDQSEAMSLADTMAVMRDGGVEQVGPPASLYHTPATPFVAGFLGGATLVSGRVERGVFTNGAFALRLPGGMAKEDAASVTLAIRPEAISFAMEAGGDSGMAARVEGKEHLGFTTAFRLAAGGISLKAIMLSSAITEDLHAGTDVRITIDGSKCSCFPEGR